MGYLYLAKVKSILQVRLGPTEQKLASLLEWRDRRTEGHPEALPDTERGGGLSSGGDRPVQVNKTAGTHSYQKLT